MGQGGGQQLYRRAVRSEQCVGPRSGEANGNARARRGFLPVHFLGTGFAHISFLLILQEVSLIYKTRNQFPT